jgi:hypothetical protein
MITIVIYIFLAGQFNGVMDGIQFLNYWLNKYAWFNPELSALNKWEHYMALHPGYDGIKFEILVVQGKYYLMRLNTKRLWCYLWLYKPKYIEAFPYSSTMLVWVTQGWHFAKMLTFSVYEVIITYFILEKYKSCFEGHPILLIAAYPLTFLALKLMRFLGFSTTYR